MNDRIEGIGQASKKTGSFLWPVVWRSAVGIAVLAMWLIPESWHFNARHSAFFFAMNFIIVGLSVIGGFVGALIETVMLVTSLDVSRSCFWLRVFWLVGLFVHIVAMFLS